MRDQNAVMSPNLVNKYTFRHCTKVNVLECWYFCPRKQHAYAYFLRAGLGLGLNIMRLTGPGLGLALVLMGPGWAELRIGRPMTNTGVRRKAQVTNRWEAVLYL